MPQSQFDLDRTGGGIVPRKRSWRLLFRRRKHGRRLQTTTRSLLLIRKTVVKGVSQACKSASSQGNKRKTPPAPSWIVAVNVEETPVTQTLPKPLSHNVHPEANYYSSSFCFLSRSRPGTRNKGSGSIWQAFTHKGHEVHQGNLRNPKPLWNLVSFVVYGFIRPAKLRRCSYKLRIVISPAPVLR
jgi:hypothetical protein